MTLRMPTDGLMILQTSPDGPFQTTIPDCEATGLDQKRKNRDYIGHKIKAEAVEWCLIQAPLGFEGNGHKRPREMGLQVFQ